MRAEKYLDLVKSTLLNEVYLELEAQLLFSVLCAAENVVMDLPDFWAVRQDGSLLARLKEAKASGDTVILETGSAVGRPFANDRLRNYSEYSYTLVGRKRLDHLQQCMEQILAEGIPGDFLEAGVWRGGCCIFMRALLEAHECVDRRVWLFDSFQGLPPATIAADRPYPMSRDRLPFLAVAEEEVRGNFERFGLLDEQVRFVPGWFSESLAGSPVESIALLRVDADLYSSTFEVLSRLYPRVSKSGWVVIDDYHTLPPCRQAVDDFLEQEGIDVAIEPIDEQAVCWRVT